MYQILEEQENRNYKVGRLKVFGGLQIGLGSLCGILSIAGIALDGINLNKKCFSKNYDHSDHNCDSPVLLAFDITCLIFSGWFILTGCFPFCMNDGRRRNWRCLKIFFMVCCILGASIFVPTIVTLGAIGAILRGDDGGGALLVLPSAVAFFGFVEFVVAVVAASYCCCCLGLGGRTQPGLVYGTSNQPTTAMGLPNTQITTSPQMAGNSDFTSINAGVYPANFMTQQCQISTVSDQMSSNIDNPPPYKSLTFCRSFDD